MTLDHGILNLPLSKRGDIDRQIDAWKAEQARLAKAAARARRAAAPKITADEAKAATAAKVAAALSVGDTVSTLYGLRRVVKINAKTVRVEGVTQAIPMHLCRRVG